MPPRTTGTPIRHSGCSRRSASTPCRMDSEYRPRDSSNSWRLRPFAQRHEGDVVLAHVDLFGAINLVALQLLQPVGEPAGDAGDGEDRREQVARDAERLV